jgi:hypothetical protein
MRDGATEPKFTPEANSIILFGPGVMEVVKANSTSAINVSAVMISPVKATLPMGPPSDQPGKPIDEVNFFDGSIPPVPG